ncbi:phenylalanine--tRNA ligase subunit alpha [Candidatus Woesearchaeota archaeon]|nr:phenylalanine--tRNA ligase subunit alpha [Candidatus Woesearchaeota archaeon]
MAEQDLAKLVSSLHPLERQMLPLIEKHSKVSEIIAASGLSDTEANRAAQWLAGKSLINANEKYTETASLGTNGKKYAEEGLPERRFLEAIKGTGKGLIADIRKNARLSEEELNICIGLLRKLGAIEIRKEANGLAAYMTEEGKKLQSKGLEAEQLLKKKFPIDTSTLTGREKTAVEQLRQRKDIIRIEPEKEVNVQLTELGRAANKEIKEGTGKDLIDRLTPQILRTGAWKNRLFRRYDLSIPAPKVYGGKKQHYRRFLEEVRAKFVALGFTEMSGPIVETEFWDMDALFMPQFHSARDIHDAYYVKEPKQSTSLPADIVARVKAAHEKGTDGSRGWRYTFDTERTRRHILRTQDTAISPRVLSSPELRIPGKYFQMVRCFRHDVIDATHLADFNQTGGFVIEEGISFRHLVGLLRLFAKEFANADDVKVVPAYFPFTEPSAALYAKHPEMGWIELAGSGIFRPEMTHPLGVKTPVIAWGVGVERLAMFRFGLKDIRDLFSHDLAFLRNVKVV